MSNGTDTLISRVVVAIVLMAPMAVEFIDTKQRESNVANVFIRPLEEIEAQGGLAIKLEIREESSPGLSGHATPAHMIKSIVIVVTKDTGSVCFATSMVCGPAM